MNSSTYEYNLSNLGRIWNDNLDETLTEAIERAENPDVDPTVLRIFEERSRRIAARQKEIADIEVWEERIDEATDRGYNWSQIAMHVTACPFCHRGPGQRCRGKEGQLLHGGRRAHKERITAYGRIAMKVYPHLYS